MMLAMTYRFHGYKEDIYKLIRENQFPWMENGYISGYNLQRKIDELVSYFYKYWVSSIIKYESREYKYSSYKIMSNKFYVDWNLDFNAKCNDIRIYYNIHHTKDIVADNCNELLGDIYTSDEIKEIYSYLSKITHVTNIKEAVSYLSGNKRIKGYIVNEIKYVSLIIENLYITLFSKKSKLDNSMCDNIISVAGYVELINTMYYVANSTGETKRIESYFYGEKNKKYLEKQKELMISDFKELQSNKDELSRTIKIISKELDKQLAENNYTEMVNKILNS